MKLLKIKLLALLLLTILSSCDSDDNETGISNPNEVAAVMNQQLILPPGSFIVNPDEVDIDESIAINQSSTSVIPLSPGMIMENNISFVAPNGNVAAVGMRFGDSGPIAFVPVNSVGATSGIGSFQFSIPDNICNNLSQICHDIKCYEFAQTTDGKISAANIVDVAMLCGNCDEPSCQGLVNPEDCDDDGGLNPSGEGTFSINNTTYDIDFINGSFYFEALGQNNGSGFFDFQSGGVAVSDFNIGFGICWDNSSDNVTGTYTRNDDFNAIGWEISCSNVDISTNQLEDLVSGTLTVSLVSANEYNVQFSGSDSAGNQIEINFTSPITVI